MKTIKLVIFCILISLLMSCSSQDNSPIVPTTFVVLDAITYDRYATDDVDEEGNEEESERTYYGKSIDTYTYDTEGRVSVIDSDQWDETHRETVVKKLFFYNEKGKLSAMKIQNVQTNKELCSRIFEYSTEGWIDKVIERKDNHQYVYGYSVCNFIITLSMNVDNKESTTYFEYDLAKNIVRVSNSNSRSLGGGFTYDQKKTPYTNMNIDLMYEDYSLLNALMPLKLVKHNITSWNTIDGETTTIVYEYNEDDLPSKQTIYEERDKTKIKSIRQFKYKKISVKKNNLGTYENGKACL